MQRQTGNKWGYSQGKDHHNRYISPQESIFQNSSQQGGYQSGYQVSTHNRGYHSSSQQGGYQGSSLNSGHQSYSQQSGHSSFSHHSGYNTSSHTSSNHNSSRQSDFHRPSHQSDYQSYSQRNSYHGSSKHSSHENSAPSQSGYQSFHREPQDNEPRYSGHSFSQHDGRGDHHTPYTKDRPLVRPSHFSGQGNGQRHGNFQPNSGNSFGGRGNFIPNSGNPFGSKPDFQNFSNNGPRGMMRGPRPDFNHHNGPRFHNKQFNKKGQQQPPKKQQPQQEKKEVKYFCDTCDRGFKEEGKYKEHVDGHEKCRFPGCSYIAAPKLVQLHITWQHKSGFAKKIWSLETPEDVKKWREERKKRYPTSENIAKKEASQTSREQRGEVIQEKYFGKMRGRGRGRGGRFDRRRKGDDSEADGTQPKQRKIDETSLQDDGSTVADADPLSSILSQDVSANTEDSPTVSVSTGSTVNVSTGSTVSGVSTGSTVIAAAGLGSLSEEEGEIKEDTGGEESRLGTSPVKQNNPVAEGEPQEISENKVTESKQNQFPGKKNKKKRKKKQQQGKGPHPQHINKSLLEKLLAKEIRQERNKILQCVHYIVKKNFFGVGKSSS